MSTASKRTYFAHTNNKKKKIPKKVTAQTHGQEQQQKLKAKKLNTDNSHGQKSQQAKCEEYRKYK